MIRAQSEIEVRRAILKKCRLCGKRKSRTAFYNHIRYKDGLDTRCKECTVAVNIENNKKNPNRHYELRLKNLYGITLEEYNGIFRAQHGRCGICRKKTIKRLNVDHCHITGIVRGLLCYSCNTGLGKLGDSIEGLERALVYLERAYDVP